MATENYNHTFLIISSTENKTLQYVNPIKFVSFLKGLFEVLDFTILTLMTLDRTDFLLSLQERT